MVNNGELEKRNIHLKIEQMVYGLEAKTLAIADETANALGRLLSKCNDNDQRLTETGSKIEDLRTSLVDEVFENL